MKVGNNELRVILNKFNKEYSEYCYPENFKIIIKNILCGPNLSIYLFNDPNLCMNKNFSNINLGRYWTDLIVYQIKKQLLPQLITHLETIDLSDILNLKSFNPNIIITINEYPYVIPNTNYKLYIIWNKDSNKPLTYSQIQDYFDLDNKDWIIWKNNNLYKSLKCIEHYHIIIRDSLPKFVLTKLLILQRHGPREPITIPPKFIKSYWKNIDLPYDLAVSKANLTDLGKLYCKFVGEQLYNNYFEDFKFKLLDKNSILFGSSNFLRTIETSILTLNGLDLSDNNLDLNLFNFLSSDNIFSSSEKEMYNYKLKYSNINFDIDLSEINKEIFDLTGIEIKDFSDYFELASTMRCYEFHGYQMLPDSQNNLLLLKIKNTIYNLATCYYNQVNDPTNDYFNLNRHLGKTVIDNLLEIFEFPNVKLSLLTSHDNLLMPTVKYLIHGIIDGSIKFEGFEYDKEFYTKSIKSKLNYLDFPDFNSSIRLELWIEPNTNSKKIRIYYCNLMLFEFNTK